MSEYVNCECCDKSDVIDSETWAFVDEVAVCVDCQEEMKNEKCQCCGKIYNDGFDGACSKKCKDELIAEFHGRI